MPTVFNVTANDTAPQIFTLTDRTTGLPLDLSAVTSIQLKFRLAGTTTTLATVTPTVYGTPTNGQISVPMTSLLAARAAGLYEGEVQLTSPAGIQTLQPPMQFNVIADFT